MNTPVDDAAIVIIRTSPNALENVSASLVSQPRKLEEVVSQSCLKRGPELAWGRHSAVELGAVMVGRDKSQLRSHVEHSQNITRVCK